jgi:serine/threonine protein kinase
MRDAEAIDINLPTILFRGSSGEESRVGHYKLLQEIGRGGMGVVYMAEQSHPVSRRVALKIIKPGMDSKEVLARFEAERQALALMDHPHIARVLDAGTTDKGLPYFVMELVKGVPITTYCDEKQLSPRERLELFIPVCQAVQHAHQKGVIHRDLKPSNVLVAQYDNQPIPKVIDFGLAKAVGQRLTDKTMFTQYGQIVGTIDYMSPEQATFNQLDVDTRSDIYSLGVLLYELLTGETPFDKKRLHSAAIDEMLRIIRQEEPPRPSVKLSSHAEQPSTAENRRRDTKQLSSLIRGELDWIVMKAIDKVRDRRYQTAVSFADDIHRYLEHETVQACPPSLIYRMQKYARRNKALLTSAGVVLAALLAGLTGTTWALVRAWAAEIQLAGQVRELNQRNVHLLKQINVTMSQAEGLDRLDQATCRLLDQLTKQVSQDERLDIPDLREVKNELLDRGLQFWDEMIASGALPSGKMNPRTGEYRLQRALCLARARDHQRAYEEVQLLRGDQQRLGHWAPQLVRICALCSTAAGTDTGLGKLYVDEAARILEQAALTPETAPPSATDRELNALKSIPDFEATLEHWQQNWNEQRAKPSHAL